MKNKKEKKYVSDYLEYICFLVMLALCLYVLLKNILLGLAAIIVTVAIIYVWSRNKRLESDSWREEVKSLTMTCDKMTRTSIANIPVPVCFIELNGRIIWANKKFEEMVSDKYPIDKELEDYVGDITLRKILDETKVIEDEYSFNDRDYRIVYYFNKKNDIQDGSVDYMAVIYWFDITDLKNLNKELENNREVVLNIQVDGYEEVMKSTPEENRPIIAMDIERLLTSLQDETKGLLTKVTNDKYLLFTNEESLNELEKSKFSVLEKAREIEHGNSLPVTMSIGVGRGGDTIEKTGEFASGAMDMALGRGGDQVAVRDKEGFNFYGGKSKGYERKTKVKSRLIGLALKEIINQSNKILIMGHHYPDMDAMGAAVGVYDICKSFGKKANIVLNDVTEAVEIFVERVKEDDYYQDIFISHDKAIDMCDENTLVIVVDTHRPSYTECSKLLDISKRIVLIDHHRRGVEYINDTVLLFHEIYVSSTCEMVTELIQYIDADININKLTAEGLLGGIYLDTKNFEFKTGVRTFEAASFLRNMGADTLSVKKFFNSHAEDFLVKAEIIQRTEIIDNKICISYSNEQIDNINIVIAKAADELLNIKKIEASFVLGMKGDVVFVSARSIGDINVHVLMEKIGGGGHLDIAGAQLKDVSLSQAYNMVKEIITDYLEEEE